MSVRTTVDLPEPLYQRLRLQADRSGASIRSLIVGALEQTDPGGKKPRRVTGPMIARAGKRGPRYPADESPHDLVFFLI